MLPKDNDDPTLQEPDYEIIEDGAIDEQALAAERAKQEELRRSLEDKIRSEQSSQQITQMLEALKATTTRPVEVKMPGEQPKPIDWKEKAKKYNDTWFTDPFSATSSFLAEVLGPELKRRDEVIQDLVTKLEIVSDPETKKISDRYPDEVTALRSKGISAKDAADLVRGRHFLELVAESGASAAAVQPAQPAKPVVAGDVGSQSPTTPPKMRITAEEKARWTREAEIAGFDAEDWIAMRVSEKKGEVR